MRSRSEYTPEEERYAENCLKQLKASVEQVALSAEEQIERFKGFDASYVVAAEFANWCRWALIGSKAPKLTSEQSAALRALDEHLEEMSGPENARFWCDGALVKNPRWQRARELAREILRQFM